MEAPFVMADSLNFSNLSYYMYYMSYRYCIVYIGKLCYSAMKAQWVLVTSVIFFIIIYMNT